MARKYAETTKVPVEQSQAEIRTMLKSLGADQIGIMYDGNNGDLVVFKLKGVMYQFSNPPIDLNTKNVEQANKSAWRSMVLLIKAKKVAIEQGISTVEREFMADTVMRDGSKMIDHHAALISHNYSDGLPRIGFAG